MRYLVPALLAGILLCTTFRGKAQCPAAIPLTISNVATTESRCQSSGSATITVSGGTAPYVYTITHGPVQPPPQSSNIFESLAAGYYTVRITDNCNTSVVRNFTIAGSYGTPNVSAYITNTSCPGEQDGQLDIMVTGGRGPFTYALIAPSPVTVPVQTSNVFNNLPAGNYTYQVTDSCGNFQTRTVSIIQGDNAPFEVSYQRFRYIDCDSFYLPYYIRPFTYGHYRYPYTVTFTLPNNVTITHTLDASTPKNSSGYLLDTFYFRFHHTPYSMESWTIDAANNCGASGSTWGYFTPLDMWKQFIQLSGCGGQYRYTFDEGDNNPSRTDPSILHCATVTYSLYDPGGAHLITQTNNSTFEGYPAGNGYKLVREDCCQKDSIYFDWEQVPPIDIASAGLVPAYTNKEGTTALHLVIFNAFYGHVIIESGPPSVTFKDGTVHHYSYPDTLSDIPFAYTSLFINYLTAGNYKIYALDTCGNKDSVSITIDSSDLRHSTLAATLKKGCVDDNRIVYTANTNIGALQLGHAMVSVSERGYWRYLNTSETTDSMLNVPPGTYTLQYLYSDIEYQNSVRHLKGMSAYTADTITQRFTVLPYTQPTFASLPAAVAVCGSNRTMAMLPDSSAGVAPYQYMINGGPVTRASQASPVFSNLPAGTYNVLMADACGNSYSRNISIDSLAVPAINVQGTACQGTPLTLTLPGNAYYSYSWQRPDGSIVPGNTLALNAVNDADTGRYTITVASNINGCTDSKSSTVQVNYCSVMLPLPIHLLHFSCNRQNDKVVLQWKTANEQNASHFIVERSTDGRHFTALHRIMATGTKPGIYTTVDQQAPTGKLYYRLLMADKDGSSRYSTIVTVNAAGEPMLTVTPRLITGNSEIRVNHSAVWKAAHVQLTTIDGRVLMSRPVAAGSTSTLLPTTGLANGSYFVRYMENGKQAAVQVVKW
ncbi:SprB repeat-containing protein [Longitalea arenae]|uniref:SprB repeat-containing protein n=1 Tax=Longitalea arenae TaxID=2812558 RepID=UPI001967A9A3|nr:SprB repeat-containing protein [Longitalea arenae]